MNSFACVATAEKSGKAKDHNKEEIALNNENYISISTVSVTYLIQGM